MITAKYINQDNPLGFAYDLKVGESYEVENITMSSSFTFITLKGKKGVYNSISFEFYEDGKPLNIYEDTRFNPYLR